MGEANHDQRSFEIASEDQLSDYMVTAGPTGKFKGDAVEEIMRALKEAKLLIQEKGGLTKEEMDSLGLKKKE